MVLPPLLRGYAALLLECCSCNTCCAHFAGRCAAGVASEHHAAVRVLPEAGGAMLIARNEVLCVKAAAAWHALNN